MIQKIKRPVSILLTVLMVFSVFAVVPFTASAAVGDVLSEDDYLTFTAEEAGSTVTLNVATGSNLQYDLNGTGLTGYTGTTITLANAGDYVRFRGKATTFDYSHYVSIDGKVACSGNVMSLRLDDNDRVQGLTNYCFWYMFNGCAGLITAPELPETTLATSCYNRMFSGCTSLITAPELPATMLENYCYYSMFQGCTSLITAPELHATMLATSCYSDMFFGCSNLTAAPELPATTLADECYSSMFRGCTSLTTAPELPATMLANYCYDSMFYGCTSLTAAPELPATSLAYNCYSNMFNGCTSLTAAPALPATTLANFCYDYMFSDCTSLTELPALPATDLSSNCYRSMFSGCSKIYVSDEAGTFDGINYSVAYRIPSEGTAESVDALYNMFASTGGKFKGTPSINTTYYLPAPAPTTYTITWNNWDGSQIDTTEVEEGVVPTHADATKEADEQYTYTFAGWDPTPVAASANTTYTAKFNETPKTHVHDGVTFEKWTSDNSLPTEAGNYVLTSDVALSGTWTVPEGETNLCLAGYTIRQSGSGSSVIQLNNVNEKLTVYDDGTTGTITGGNTNGDGGGVHITAGTFTLKGGNIEGNVASNGGGVSVSGQSSYFNMVGGTVRYNAAYTYTGGVLQMSSGNFTMTGGTIQNNVGKVYGGVGIADAQPSMSGNAVVKDNVFFSDITASDTKITKTASGYTVAPGGTPCDVRHATRNGLKINVTGAFESGAQIGVFNDNQTAAFTSGFGTNNPDGAPADYFFSNDSNRFVMLSANKEAQLGGYFTVTWKNDDGTVLETDENVSTGTNPEFNGTEPTKASDGVATSFEFIGWTPAVSPVTGDVTYTATYNAIMPDHEHDGIVYKGWASKNSLPTEAGNYYLGYDVTLPSTWTVSKNIRLCLNGNGITKNGGNVITIVGGGNLTIDDCGTKTHYFDVNNGKAVNVNTTPGENRKSFTGGYITGGTGQSYNGFFWSDGGGIYLDGGNFTFNGGTILGNSANFGGGVGIYSGTMTMNGGTVCYNTGNAGISFRTGSYEYNRGIGATTGYFVMNGGLVAYNNSGVTTAGYSYGNDYATFNGGKIVNNVNTGVYSNNLTIAGDIEITGNKNGAGFRDTCSISGNPVITGNTNANLSINNGKIINTGTLGENAKIGVTMSNPGVFTNGYGATIEPTEIFTADDPTTFIEKNAAGEVKLGIYVWTASFNAGGGSGTMDPIEVQKERSFNLPECTLTPPEGKLFLNWSDGTNTYNPGDSYTMTADTEFTAQWMDGIKVSFKANGGSGVMEDVYSYPGNYKLPACGFTASEGKLFLNWSDGTNTYNPGDTVTLTADIEFTAQWIDGIKVSFKANGGSGVMEDVLSYPGDYKLPACGFTAPEGMFFNGWLSSADNQVYQTGDTVTLTAETQFTAQWGTGAKYQFDFEDGVPEGWQSTSGRYGDKWYLNANGGDYEKFDAHSGQKNMTRFGSGTYDSVDLITSNFDLSNAESATLGFWYTNRNWYGDIDQLVVYYQVGDGAEVKLFETSDVNHEGWTEAEITLPSEAFAENVHFLFRAIDGYGYGVALDDVELNITGSKDLISGHSLTLDGDIGINFYIDPSAAGMNAGNAIDSLTYTLEWETPGVAKKALTDMGKSISQDGKSIIVTCKVCAAEMTCGVKASFSLGTKTANEVYSVRKYCDEGILGENAPYKNDTKLVYLAKTMLDYGAKAQTVFGVKTGDLANEGLDYTMPTGTPDFDAAVLDANGENSNISEAQISGGSFKFATLVFLSESTLRLYFENTGGLPTGGMTKWNDYYYMQKTDIPANKLDTLQQFTVGNTTLTYSALDYAKGLSTNANTDYVALAKAIYWYNQAANEYFG